MAITFSGYELSLTVTDKAAQDSILTYELVAADETEAIANAATVVAALNAVTDSVVKGQRIARVYFESAFSAPVTGLFNSDKAVVSGRVEGAPNKSAIFTIPNPVDGIFGAAGTSAFNNVDLADAALLTYAALYQTGGVVLISDGEELGGLVKGVRVTRASRNP